MKVINDQGSGCYRILLINYYHNEVKSRTLLLTYQPTVITLNRKKYHRFMQKKSEFDDRWNVPYEKYSESDSEIT